MSHVEGPRWVSLIWTSPQLSPSSLHTSPSQLCLLKFLLTGQVRFFYLGNWMVF